MNECCGNCKHFKNKDTCGFGLCQKDGIIIRCHTACGNYSSELNGWTEITPDNEHELTDELISKAVIGWLDNYNRQHIVAFEDCVMGIGTMAKYGGYYYYVLPELKIE